MLGSFGLAIPGPRVPAFLAVRGAQSPAFGLLAAINYNTLVAVGVPQWTPESGRLIDRLSRFTSSWPLMAAGNTAILVVLLVVASFLGRRKIGRVRRQARDGPRISPRPSDSSGHLSPSARLVPCQVRGFPRAACRVRDSGHHLDCCPLDRHARAAQRAACDPGGFGVTQAIDVIALRDYAAPEVVTAYSLSDIAISFVVSVAIALAALLSVNDWRGIRALLGRGECSEDLDLSGSKP